jgi:hypothetical protein
MRNITPSLLRRRKSGWKVALADKCRQLGAEIHLSDTPFFVHAQCHPSETTIQQAMMRRRLNSNV